MKQGTLGIRELDPGNDVTVHTAYSVGGGTNKKLTL